MMTPGLLAELSRYPAFPETARVLVLVAGMDAAAKLIAKWPGQEPSIPSVVGGGKTGHSQYLWARLVEVVGHQAAANIVNHFRGGELQIPNCKAVIYQRAQEMIREKFDQMTGPGGVSYREAVFELGIEFCLARKSVERILKRPGVGVDVMPLMPESARHSSKKVAITNLSQGSLF